MSARDELIQAYAPPRYVDGGRFEELLDTVVADAERTAREQVATDFAIYGERQPRIALGMAQLIAREGLCACRGGRAACPRSEAR